MMVNGQDNGSVRIDCDGRRTRRRTALAIPITVAIGLACKFYSGPAANFVNNFGPASVAYVILLMLTSFLVRPRRTSIASIAVMAFLVTCGIEFSQLWHPDWLTSLRGTLPGRLILGTTFNIADFPAYLAGAFIGSLILKQICKGSPGDDQTSRQHSP